MAVNKFKLNAKGLRQLRRDLSIGAKGQPLRDCFIAIGDVYLNFAEDTYLTNARGGGKWPGLADSTLEAKRRAGNTNPVILIANKDLLNALNRGRAGNEFTLTLRGVTVGFNDKQNHPTANMSYRELAVIHEDGDPKKNRPPRQILIESDAKTKRLFQIIVDRCTKQLVRKAARRL